MENTKDNWGRVCAPENILSEMNIGLWTLEIDEGKDVRLYADDMMLGLIGLKERLSPEEMYKIWYAGVDKDYYEEVNAYLDNMVAGKYMEIVYPWHNPDGTTYTIRCSGIRDMNYTDGVRIDGTHSDVSDVARIEKDKLKELTDMIAAMTADYESVIHVNFDTMLEEKYRTSSLIAKICPEWKDETNYNRRCELLAQYLIIPEDRAQFLEEVKPQTVMANISGGKAYFVNFRASIEGRTYWYQVKFVHHKAHKSNKCALIAIYNNDEAIHKEMRGRSILNGLGEDYSYISYINPITEKEEIYKYNKDFMNSVYGWEAENIYSENIRLIAEKYVYFEDREQFLIDTDIKTLYKYLKKKKVKYITFREQVDGQIVYYQGKFVLVNFDGEENIVSGYRNVDDSVIKEKRQKEALQEAVKMAESSNRAKTVFLNSISHDIRTPMNAIIGYTELASNNIDNLEKVKEYLNKIGQSSAHLLALINDVLDMSRIESGNVKIEEKLEDINEIIEVIGNIVRADAYAKGLEFLIEAVDVTDNVVFCDRLRLNQVMLNILSNAIKYTPAGGKVILRVREQKAENENYARYIFEVIDTGIGMSEEYLRTIFEPFTRAKSSTVSGIQGTGLGMPISKRIIDLMGGDISISSKEGEGTEAVITFTFRLNDSYSGIRKLNANDCASDDATVTKAIDRTCGGATVAEAIDCVGKKILLVEDNEMNREIAMEILSENGFVVDSAEDGTVAVDIMRRANPGDYDIILMDVQMPVMDGYIATQTIRKLAKEGVNNIPIIAMTANAFEEDRKRALEVGMNDHIAKPVDIAQMKKVICKYI
ncbi:MAG: response regulator [Lachnospiraceae bacterium]|nr:response regulator [Candidatus Colinaster equi]